MSGHSGATRICAMMIYDPAKYKEPKLSDEELQIEIMDKQKVSVLMCSLVAIIFFQIGVHGKLGWGGRS